MFLSTLWNECQKSTKSVGGIKNNLSTTSFFRNYVQKRTLFILEVLGVLHLGIVDEYMALVVFLIKYVIFLLVIMLPFLECFIKF